MLGGTFFTAVSQILLKQSSNIKYENKIREYLNFQGNPFLWDVFPHPSFKYLVLYKS